MPFKASFLRGYCLFQGVEAPSFSLIFISSLLLALPGFPSAQTEGLTRNKTVEFSNLSSSTVVGSSSRSIWNLCAFSVGTCRWSWFASGAKVTGAWNLESQSPASRGIGQSGIYRNLRCKCVSPTTYCNGCRKC